MCDGATGHVLTCDVRRATGPRDTCLRATCDGATGTRALRATCDGATGHVPYVRRATCDGATGHVLTCDVRRATGPRDTCLRATCAVRRGHVHTSAREHVRHVST